MKSLSVILSTASGVFAVVPGITVMISEVGVPPDSSKALFAGIIEALGVITLMLLWLNRKSIIRQSSKTVTKRAILGVVLFIISLFSYIFLYGILVEEVFKSTPVFFPLWENGELKELLSEYGSRSALIKEFGRDDIFELIQQSSKVPLLLTTILFLFIYQLIFVSLTFSFGLLAVKSSADQS